MSVVYNTAIVRDGLALHLDAANPKSFSPNVHPNPLDVYTWVAPGGAYQMTLSRETSFTSPAGGQPLKIVTTGTSGPYTGTYNNSSWNLANATSGQTWTFSFWVKGSSNFSASAMIFGANTSGGYVELGQPTYNVTTDWTRVSGSYTLTNASTAYVQFRFDVYVNGVTMWVDGLQIERASSASSFSSITNINGNSWYDLSGNGNTHYTIGTPTFSNKIFTLNETQGFQRSAAMTGVTNSNTVVLWYSTTDTQELWVRGNNSGSLYLSASYGNNYYHASCGSPTNYVDLNVTTNPATPINYRNGAFHMWEAKNVDFSSWTVYDWFLYGTSWNMNGNISAICVYNRTLSAAESAQNFAAFRGRYGV